jgi:hypothetical protein
MARRNYTAVNAFLDAFAAYLQARGLRATAVDLGRYLPTSATSPTRLAAWHTSFDARACGRPSTSARCAASFDVAIPPSKFPHSKRRRLDVERGVGGRTQLITRHSRCSAAGRRPELLRPLSRAWQVWPFFCGGGG